MLKYLILAAFVTLLPLSHASAETGFPKILFLSKTPGSHAIIFNEKNIKEHYTLKNEVGYRKTPSLLPGKYGVTAYIKSTKPCGSTRFTLPNPASDILILRITGSHNHCEVTVTP